MFAALPLSLYSLTTQRILSQSSNISYGLRGIYRTHETPDDRKADYNFRDFQITWLTNGISELGLRAVQTLYVSPRMTEALGLNRLSEIYGKQYPGVAIKNYARLPEIIRARVMGSLVRPDSMSKVPDLLEQMEAEMLRKEGHTLPDAEKLQLRILLDHLHKSLNFKDYIQDLARPISNDLPVAPEKRLTQAEAKFILGQRQRLLDLHGAQIMGTLESAIKSKNGQRKAALEKMQGILQHWEQEASTLATHTDLEQFRQLQLQNQLNDFMQNVNTRAQSKGLKRLKFNLGTYFKQIAQNQDQHHLNLSKNLDWEQHLPDARHAKVVQEKLLNLVKEGLSADKILNQLKHIQKNSTWPQMACSVLLTFIFYGTIANSFDVKVLQPWQKKLVERQGTAQAYVGPSYTALLPALAIGGLALQNKWQFNAIRKLSYFNRFAFALVAAVAAYMAAFFPLLKKSIQKFDQQMQTNQQAAPAPQASAFGTINTNPMALNRTSAQPFTASVPAQTLVNFNSKPQAYPTAILPSQNAVPNAFSLQKPPVR